MDHFSFASSITFASGSSAASNPSKTTQLNYEFNDKAPKICYHNDIKRFFRNDLKGVHNKMTKFVNPDNLAFQTSLNAQIYVDKSELIEYTNSVLSSTDAYICNSRPRRFGKSITANMLVAYYSKGCDSEAMFSNLKISKSIDFKKHLNQHNVIHFDIQWCIEPAGGPEHVVSYISKQTIAELRECYPGILNDDIVSLPEALFNINVKTGSQFIIIIDEWDVLIRDEASDLKIQEQYINFLRGLFKGAAPTRYIQLAYLTGILPIKREKTQSALNNFREFTMVSPKILQSTLDSQKKKFKTCVLRTIATFKKSSVGMMVIYLEIIRYTIPEQSSKCFFASNFKAIGPKQLLTKPLSL